ncbi:helix-turn-helix transcriptional regulator [Parapedobacter tibetensis]|uniref:helix-turn-helix transcriptional regulator n=1 Tax=Parapedobacter tibetensis TaxID=2972951 RepID=UPI00214D39F4|nr:AraC family transcriptional regulator [Parapedobacter tibetensis]
MEHHIYLYIDGKPCVPERAFAGTTFFYFVAKAPGSTAATVTLQLSNRALLFVLNGPSGSQWVFAGGQEPLDIPPFAFFAAMAPAGAIEARLETGPSGVHCIGFSERAIPLLAEEFELFADLVDMAVDADRPGTYSLPHRFLPYTIYKYLDKLDKTDKRGFALNVHRKEALYQTAKLYHASLMAAAPKPSTTQDEDLMCRAVELIQLHFADPTFNIDRLAGQVGLSRRNLYRLFENQRQPTPQRLILNTRMEKARELLQDSHHPVSEIAGMVGFNHLSYFSAQYKAAFGHLPNENR